MKSEVAESATTQARGSWSSLPSWDRGLGARVIWIFEMLGWVSKVRWPKPERLARKLEVSPPTADECSSTEIERELLRRPERWPGNDIA